MVASFPGFPREEVESLGDYRTRVTQGRRKGRHDLIGRGREADPLERLCRFLSRAVD